MKQMNDERHQKVFLIGAQKAGTTTLAGLLSQHPDICSTQPKETHFYSNEYAKGTQWYEEHFPNPSLLVRLDASTSYSMAPIGPQRNQTGRAPVPGRIHACAPEAKFIYVLRNHEERVHSAYWHNVRGGSEPLDFRAAFLGSDEYLAPSLYCKQLDNFLEFFPLSSFKILSFNDLKASPIETALSCMEFLGLSTELQLSQGTPKNQGFQYTPMGQLIRDIAGSRNRMKFMTRIAKVIVPQSQWERVKSIASKPVPALSEDDRRWLVPYFNEDKDRLQADYGILL